MHVLVPFCISNTENCYLNVIADQTDASLIVSKTKIWKITKLKIGSFLITLVQVLLLTKANCKFNKLSLLFEWIGYSNTLK